MVATNVGLTLSDGNLSSFIFDKYDNNEIYIASYVSEVKKILRTPNNIVPTNPGKQLGKPYYKNYDRVRGEAIMYYQNQLGSD